MLFLQKNFERENKELRKKLRDREERGKKEEEEDEEDEESKVDDKEEGAKIDSGEEEDEEGDVDEKKDKENTQSNEGGQKPTKLQSLEKSLIEMQKRKGFYAKQVYYIFAY